MGGTEGSCAKRSGKSLERDVVTLTLGAALTLPRRPKLLKEQQLQ